MGQDHRGNRGGTIEACLARAVRPAFACLLSVAALVTGADAQAASLPGPAPTPGAPGLPDGRVYEQVSPIQKNGSEAGAPRGTVGYAVASRGGDSVLYYQSGPFGQTASGTDEYSVSRRAADGWSASAALPPAFGRDSSVLLATIPRFIAPSQSFERFVFSAFGSYVSEDPIVGEAGTSSAGIFLAGEDNASEPAWVTRPAFPPPFSEAMPQPGHTPTALIAGPAGASPDLSTVYFVYHGTLTPEDATRAPHIEGEGKGPAGFYEWRDGALADADQLPDGSYPEWGGVPASTGGATESGSGLTPADLGNQVSDDGSKAFFVSPDPESAHPESEPVELYVRERDIAGGATTVLVSKSQLPGHEGEPAQGSGNEQAVVPVLDQQTGDRSYVYAAPDGSRAFFLSTDKLADSAEGAEPMGEGPWMYEFDSQTGQLTYLPGVSAPILTSSPSGDRLLFEKREARTTVNAEVLERTERELREECEEEEEVEETTLPQCTASEITRRAEAVATEEVVLPVALSLWSAGGVQEIAGWSIPATPDFQAARSSPDGSAFVFDTDAVLSAGAFNNGGVHHQVYRYDVAANQLACLSCPPSGVPPSGDATLSHDERNAKAGSYTSNRGLAGEAEEVFFDTPEALVRSDVDGARDVYEWHEGELSLISSGTSPAGSFYLDNGESGSDVFFATSQGLTAGDEDGSYDVYDARVGGGFPSVAPTPECHEDCQGAVAPPPSFLAPFGSAVFPAGENVPATTPAPTKPVAKKKALTRARKLAKALRDCRKKPKRKRAACTRSAKRRYGPPSKLGKRK